MTLISRITAIAALSMLAGSVFAATTVPNVFVNGTVADADEVNENFEALSNAIDNIPAGPRGPAGISCWDLNENGVKDPDEDLNKDNVVDVLDCRPAVVDQDPGNRTWYANSKLAAVAEGMQHYMTNESGDPVYPGSRDIGGGPCLVEGVWDPDCLADPFPDPCGLFVWNKRTRADNVEIWEVRAKDGFAYAEIIMPVQYSLNPPSFGFQTCRDACLDDAQCAGAYLQGIELEDGEVPAAAICRLIAKSPEPMDIGLTYLVPQPETKQNQANFWAFRDFSLFDMAISVCPAPAAP